MIEAASVLRNKKELEKWHKGQDQSRVRIQVTPFLRDSIYDSKQVFVDISESIEQYLAERRIDGFAVYPRQLGGGFGLDWILNFALVNKEVLVSFLKIIPPLLAIARFFHSKYKRRIELKRSREWSGLRPRIWIDLTTVTPPTQGGLYFDVRRPYEQLLLLLPQLAFWLSEKYPGFELRFSAQGLCEEAECKISVGFYDRVPDQKQVMKCISKMDTVEFQRQKDYYLEFKSLLLWRKLRLTISERVKVARG